ncbi:response regulator [Peloplasma aerotolerans]|uniref:Response regulator transcription factor n=1 Tax=Peloplasma aerotolerans TaxID=3044389 RepID=A0AAW6U5J9_9MOLU|nr:response regulator transcription factor [Mariniplasma sp. M4Ah]MDI6453263.1 response regulator transcription factor [Mariniplasma sp. M4Ah]
MTNMKHILIIEDDKVILKFIKLALETNGYQVSGTEQGTIGLNIILNQNPDLILLDLGLPDIDGMQVIDEVRKIKTTPIIVVSARGRENDKVLALDRGANDYVTKPFNISEVLARIRVALRTQEKTFEDQKFIFKDLVIDFDKHMVKIDDQEIHLTPIEFKLLELLVVHQGKVLTHSFIQGKIWGYQTQDDYQSLRVFMASIRKKLKSHSIGHEYILTEVGVGYRFKEE